MAITTNWVDDGSTGTQHAYTLTFSDNGTYGVEVDMVHQRDGTVLASSHNLAWDSAAGVRTALLTFDTTLAWGDIVDLTVTITDHDGRQAWRLRHSEPSPSGSGINPWTITKSCFPLHGH